MVLTLSNAIAVESFFKLIVDIKGDITSDYLPLLQEGVSDAVTEFIGNRSLPADLQTRITALFILDLRQNSHGKGTITRESVTDNSWNVKVNSSSMWMDRAISLLTNFDSNKVAKDVTLDPVDRDDSRINGVIDGGSYRGMIYPYIDQMKEMSDQQAEDATGSNNIRVG